MGFWRHWDKQKFACDSCGRAEVLEHYHAGMSDMAVRYCSKSKCTLSISLYGKKLETIATELGIRLEDPPSSFGTAILERLAPCGCGARYIEDEWPRCLACPGHLRCVFPPQVGDIPYSDEGMGIILERHYDAEKGLELLVLKPEVAQELERREVGPLLRAEFAAIGRELPSIASVADKTVSFNTTTWTIKDGECEYIVEWNFGGRKEMYAYQQVQIWADE